MRDPYMPFGRAWYYRETGLRILKVVICNFSSPIESHIDFRAEWDTHTLPPKIKRLSLFDQPIDWGFHIYALGVYMLDKGMADEVEFWDYSETRSTAYHSNGVLRVLFHNPDDVRAYVERYGYPELLINHGRFGQTILPFFAGKSFRVHVPVLSAHHYRQGKENAECFLVDSAEELDDHSRLYIPVVNTKKIFPLECEKKRDFVYLAGVFKGKRHDLVIEEMKGRELTGHFHPVEESSLDLRGTHITTSSWNSVDLLELLRTSRIAIYAGDETSNPAAMWECVAAGLPIVVNNKIRGGKHLVVSGVTGELAAEGHFYETMKHVLDHLDSYRPREYFDKHWDTVGILERYISFFREMGFR